MVVQTYSLLKTYAHETQAKNSDLVGLSHL